MENVLINQLDKLDIENALSLVWDVFQCYEAPDYSPEGVDEFYKSIHDNNYLDMLTVYGAFTNEELIGVIATRSEGTHIALFFVNGKYHRQGIGRKLFEYALSKNKQNYMTVNSSPYAIPIYHKLGFEDTDVEQVVNGLRFTPMKRNKGIH